jgi:hypothetical protein
VRRLIDSHVDPARTRVVVLCSHGMGPRYGEGEILDEILRRLQRQPRLTPGGLYRALKGAWYRLPPGIRVRGPIARLRRAVSPWLRESVLASDLANRPYFTVPNNSVAGAIRINLAGRESHGVVAPEEYASTCAFLEREMRALRDADTGEPVVSGVGFSRELYQGPYLDELPDVLVAWRRERPPRAFASPTVGRIAVPRLPGRGGDHTPHGLALALGPGIEPGRLARSIKVDDLGPTFAAWAGVELVDVDGRPVPEWVQRAAATAR